MKSVRKEFIKILTGKSLWILIIFLAVISVASGFSGPTSIVAKRFGTRVGKNVYMVPFAVIYSFSQILNIVLALMTTLSVHDLQKPKTDAAAGFRQGLIARWIAGTGAAAMSILPCSLLWCMKRKAFWPVSEKITDYDRKLIVFLAAFLPSWAGSPVIPAAFRFLPALPSKCLGWVCFLLSVHPWLFPFPG